MANYFVINNKFRPYSFDELIKPYQIYGQAYKEQEALLDAAREKEFSPEYLDPNLDQEAHQLYDTASQKLQAVSDELATKGLSAGLRGRLRSAAKDYQRNMAALTTAQEQLAEERARRAKAGTDYVYQQDALRIGDFLYGRNPNNNSVKKSEITTDIAAEFATKAKSITKDTWNKVLGPNGKPIAGYYDVTTKGGLEEDQLNAVLALANPEAWNRYVAANPTITDDQKEKLRSFVDVIKTKMDSIGFNQYSESGQKEIWNAVVKGAHAGLATETHDYKQDRTFESPELRYRKDRDEAEDKRLNEERDMLSGKEPYFVDQDGNKYFMNNKTQTMWTTDKDGKVIDKPKYKTQVGKKDAAETKEETERAKVMATAKTELPMYMKDSGPFSSNSTWSRTKGVGDFNPRAMSEPHRIDISSLNPYQRQALNIELSKYGLTTDDIVIYKDHDFWNSEYAIDLVSRAADGTIITTPVGTLNTEEPQVHVDQNAASQAASEVVNRATTKAGTVGGF